MPTRPIGIAILSVLTWIIGALLLLGGLILTAVSGIVAVTPKIAEEIARTMGELPGVPVPIHSMMVIGMILAVVGVVILIVGVITLLVGWGLWTGRNWARWIAIIVFGLGALSNLINLSQGRFGSVISLIINGLIVYYLFTPHVKEFFKATV